MLNTFAKNKQVTDQFIQNSIFSAFMVTNLINDLLDHAKLENNAFQLNYEYFNLVDAI